MEEWRKIAIDGLERYQVSSEGRVRNSETGNILVGSKDTNGYRQVCLAFGKRRTLTIKVHRLVALEFLGARPKGKQINHCDGNKENNAVHNLEYVTCKENVRHAYATGIITRESKVRAALKNAKKTRRLTDDQVRSVLERVAAGESRHELAEEFGLHRNHLDQIIRGRIYGTVAVDVPRIKGRGKA